MQTDLVAPQFHESSVAGISVLKLNDEAIENEHVLIWLLWQSKVECNLALAAEKRKTSRKIFAQVWFASCKCVFFGDRRERDHTIHFNWGNYSKVNSPSVILSPSRLKPSKAEEPNLPVTSFNCRSAVGSLGLPLSAPFGQRPHFTTSAKVSACPGSQRPGSYNTYPPDKTSSPASSLEATLRAKPLNVHVVGNIQKSKLLSCESAIKYAGIDMRCNESHPSQFSKASGAFTITETVGKANFTIPTGTRKLDFVDREGCVKSEVFSLDTYTFSSHYMRAYFQVWERNGWSAKGINQLLLIVAAQLSPDVQSFPTEHWYLHLSFIICNTH